MFIRLCRTDATRIQAAHSRHTKTVLGCSRFLILQESSTSAQTHTRLPAPVLVADFGSCPIVHLVAVAQVHTIHRPSAHHPHSPESPLRARSRPYPLSQPPDSNVSPRRSSTCACPTNLALSSEVAEWRGEGDSERCSVFGVCPSDEGVCGKVEGYPDMVVGGERVVSARRARRAG